MKHNVITTKNKHTGEGEAIHTDYEKVDWGINFYVSTEIEAYKTAYIYRTSKHGVQVNFAPGNQKWMVTLFNEMAAELLGLDRS